MSEDYINGTIKAIKKIKLGSRVPPRPLKHSQNPRVSDFYYGQNPEFLRVRSETDLGLFQEKIPRGAGLDINVCPIVRYQLKLTSDK